MKGVVDQFHSDINYKLIYAFSTLKTISYRKKRLSKGNAPNAISRQTPPTQQVYISVTQKYTIYLFSYYLFITTNNIHKHILHWSCFGNENSPILFRAKKLEFIDIQPLFAQMNRQEKKFSNTKLSSVSRKELRTIKNAETDKNVHVVSHPFFQTYHAKKYI